MMAAAAPSSSASASPGAGGGPRPYRSRFGDTTLTKVFVGGLAWETPSEGLRQHFERYGDILEAVVITDRTTGRSKGYGFVRTPLLCFFSCPYLLCWLGGCLARTSFSFSVGDQGSGSVLELEVAILCARMEFVG